MAVNKIGERKPLHVFAQSFSDGQFAEQIVKQFLESELWTVTPVVQPRDKHLGDWYAFHPGFCNNHAMTLEVKCDKRAEKTGNFFIETAVNYDEPPDYLRDKYKGPVGETPGWANYLVSSWLFFYLPTDNKIWITTPQAIRRRLPKWNKIYKSDAKAYNRSNGITWHGVGTLVPVEQIRRISKEVQLTHDYRRM